MRFKGFGTIAINSREIVGKQKVEWACKGDVYASPLLHDGFIS